MLDIVALLSPKKSISINEFQLGPKLMEKLKNIKDDPNHWHKFIVYNTQGCSRDLIFQNVLSPMDIFPVHFIKKGNKAYFLARNCIKSILQLCEEKLQIKCPQYKEQTFKFNIVMNILADKKNKIDTEHNVMEVLTLRFNEESKCLSLTNFHEDDRLIAFCPLSHPKILSYILHMAAKRHPEKIILSNNNIETISVIKETLSEVPNLIALDLSNNQIPSLTALKPLRSLKSLTYLCLDGNPLCDKFNETDTFTYISLIREICPKLETLDDVLLYKNGLPAERRIFFCNYKGADLANQFVERFFTTYDTNRESIETLYDKRNVLLTITYNLSPQNSSLDLKKKSKTKLKCNGCGEIIDMSINILPKTLHSFDSFKIYLMQYSNTFAILVVDGVFKEISGDRDVFRFSRTFVLRLKSTLRCGDFVYFIANDQVTIYDPLPSDISYFENKIYLSSHVYPVSKRSCAELKKIMMMLTNLNQKYSAMFLEDCEYNLKEALENFIVLYKGDKISQEAFSKTK